MTPIKCNSQQTAKILQFYFSKLPVITDISYDNEDGIYFITGKTVVGNLKFCCQYVSSAMFIELYKQDKRYDLSQTSQYQLQEPLNDACAKAVEQYELGGELFNETESSNNTNKIFIFTIAGWVLFIVLFIVMLIDKFLN